MYIRIPGQNKKKAMSVRTVRGSTPFSGSCPGNRVIHYVRADLVALV